MPQDSSPPRCRCRQPCAKRLLLLLLPRSALPALAGAVRCGAGVALPLTLLCRDRPTPDACLISGHPHAQHGPWPHLAALCASLLLRPWLGLCCPLLINSHSLKQSRSPFARHGPPYINDERAADSSLALSRPSSTHPLLVPPVTARRPASESFASFAVLGGRKFRELALSWCPPPPPTGIYQRLPNSKIDSFAPLKGFFSLYRLDLYAFHCPLEPSIRKTCPP